MSRVMELITKPSEVLNELAYNICFYLALAVVFIILIAVLHQMFKNKYF